MISRQLRRAMSLKSEISVLNHLPVVVILGSTATGKSKLAIDLASKFGGEIISADSMQVYKGLDILTNKATTEEMKGIPHHMIGIVDRKEKFDVIHFRDRALPMVEDILKQGKLPFIVGGTNYYIESILWQVLLGQGNNDGDPDSPTSRKRKAVNDNCDDILLESVNNPVLQFMQTPEGQCREADAVKWTSQELHAALQLVDPERASKLHPNDRRKVFRSLEVRFQTGRKHSDLIAEQCAALADDSNCTKDDIKGNCTDEENQAKVQPSTALGGPLRFPNCFCLWIQADKEILHQRIDERVDEMVGRGLKQELDAYIDILREDNSDLNYEEGILQSIGFKEFHTYLQLLPSERQTEKAEAFFQEGLERLKVVTKQYAKKQLKWINQRFLRPSRRQVPPVYKLDGNLTDKLDWERNVTSISTSILDAYLNNKLDLPLLKERLVPCSNDKTDDDLIARTCEICDNRVFIGTNQWHVHLQSARHRRMVKRKDACNEKDKLDVV